MSVLTMIVETVNFQQRYVMITVRPSAERGHANHGWLDSRHTFSFADYYDEEHMAFRSLRVINEDLIAPGGGFPTHGHRDMEIISYLIAGTLAHKDSLGSQETIRPGEIQAMTAGRGVLHSEFNPSQTETAHLLQIWLQPRARGLAPAYDQRVFPETDRTNQFALIASGTPGTSALPISADADLRAALLTPGTTVTHPLAAGRHAWVQVARGTLTVNGTTLQPGDGAAISQENAVTITAQTAAEVLLFDLA